MATRHKGYKFAIFWIAVNDEPTDLDEQSVASYISTLLVADLYQQSPQKVAKDIVKKRAERSAVK